MKLLYFKILFHFGLTNELKNLKKKKKKKKKNQD